LVAMWTDRLSTVFAVLSLAAAALVIVAAWSIVAGRRSPLNPAGRILARLRRSALWLAWLTAATMTFGSLYFALGSEYFSLDYDRFFPNTLGWYQCICVIPLSVELLIAAKIDDRTIWQYAAVPVLVGAVLAVYNAQLQAFNSPAADGTVADDGARRVIWKFGFVSMPLMAVIGFALIATMLFAATTKRGEVTNAH
jgi:hypothetical protein